VPPGPCLSTHFAASNTDIAVTRFRLQGNPAGIADERRVMLCVRHDLRMQVRVERLFSEMSGHNVIQCYRAVPLYFTFLFTMTRSLQPGKVAAQCGHAVLGM
jgi:hypothetical protein